MIKSIYPKTVLRKICGELDPLDLLEYIDFHPESIQRDGPRLRASCPIHRDSVFRTLLVEFATSAYHCSKADCPGAEGGDLIDLVAKSQRIPYDEAVRRLVVEYNIDVDLPDNHEARATALREALEHLSMMETNLRERDFYAQEARTRLDQVLDSDPEDLVALRARVGLAQRTDEAEALARWLPELADAEEEAGHEDELKELLEGALERDPGLLKMRRKLAALYERRGESDHAFEQLMQLADGAEMAGELGLALEAYRGIEAMGTTGVDVAPMIDNLLLALGNRTEAASAMLLRAERLVEAGETSTAIALLETAVEADPANAAAVLLLIRTHTQSSVEPQHVGRLLGFIDGLLAAEDWDTAVEALQLLAGQFPDDTGLLDRLLQAHEHLGNYDMVAEMQSRLVVLYRDAGQMARAREVLDHVLEAFPRDRAALRHYAEIARAEGDTAAALAHYRSLAQVLESDDVEAAADVYREMIAVDGSDTTAAAGLASIAHRLEAPGRVLEWVEKAIERAMSEGHLQEAAEMARHGLDIEPAYPPFLLVQADVYDSMGDTQRATGERLQASRLMVKRGQFAGALPHLASLAAADPQSPEVNELMGDALNGLGRREEAEASLIEAARVYRARESFEYCRVVLDKVLAANPQSLAALEQATDIGVALGDEESVVQAHEMCLGLYQQRRLFDDALRHAEAILSYRPEHTRAHTERLALFRQSGDLARWATAALELAALHRAGGNTAAEREILGEVVQRQPSQIEARRLLVELLFEHGPESDLLLAIDDFREACERQGRTDDAVALLRSLSERAPDRAALQRKLVDILSATRRTEEQVVEIQRLYALHDKRGEMETMLALNKQLIGLTPDDPELRQRHAALLVSMERSMEAIDSLMEWAGRAEALGDKEQADRAFREALELDDESVVALEGRSRLAAAANPPEAQRLLAEASRIEAGRGRFDNALELLDKAYDLDPTNTELRREAVRLCLMPGFERRDLARAQIDRLAEELAAQGDVEGAILARREAVDFTPADDGARRSLVTLLSAHGRTREAAEELVALAGMQRTAARFADALATLEEALAIEPRHLPGRSLRAQVLEESGDAKAALAEWRALAPLLARAESPRPALAEPAPAPRNVFTASLEILPEYDFESFIVGDRNRFAWASAMAVAKAPGQTAHNPLFLHSDVGLGKTHILHAVANHVRRQATSVVIVYTSGEDFTSELIDAIESNTVAAFRQRYRSADLLLIDDIQFLAGKERAQDEFFHIFNSLYQARKQILLTSDRPPRDLAHLERRLVSRFGSGVIIDIQPPDFETRLAILRRESRSRPEVHVPEDAMRLLAGGINSNIRDLKGAWNQFLMLHSAGGEKLDAAVARGVIAHFAPARPTE